MVRNEQQDGEQSDAISGIGLEQAVGPTRPVGASVDPAVQAAVHSVRSSGDRDGRWGKAREDPSLGWPRRDECLGWHAPGGISQGERDHDDVVERADDRQELGDQIDRRQHPNGRNGHCELHPPRHPRVAAKPASRRDTGRQNGREVLRQPRRQPLGEQDHHDPRRGNDDRRDDQQLQPHALVDCNVCYMNSRVGPPVAWIVLIVRVPSEPSRHRVAVWRELRRVGAVQLGQGSWALPEAPAFDGFVDKMVALVGEHEGEVLALAAAAIDESTAARIRTLYDDARRAEWAEFVSECGKCLAELDKEIRHEKFTLAELDEEEQNVERLRRWHRELRSRDVFVSVDVDRIQSELATCAASLERFTHLVYKAIGLE